MVSEAVLFARLVSGLEVETEAVLETWVKLVGKGRSVMTAKTLAVVAPGERSPKPKVQVDPGVTPEQTHPGEEAAALKDVAAGTVSLSTLERAVAVPKLLTLRV